MLPDVVDEPRVMEAAEKLACLLVDTLEYQDFLRASRAVQLDAEVNNLISLMNRYPGDDFDDPALSDEALKERMEALPVVRAYRQAEAAVRALFTSVERAVSASAGVDFAANAVSGCG